jgi:carboxyvinyl-carboxyphosphonate phosphorylmutase
MDWSARRDRFRAMLEGDRCYNPVSVFDALSARVAEDLSYEVGMLPGSMVAMSLLAAPDLTLLTLTELASQALRVNRVATFPLIVDADHGYGNALNVRRTVEELECAGAAAITIEDTVLPEGYGAGAGTKLISLDEGVGKMKAALAGRQDRRLVIMGRTSAFDATGFDDAIARCKAYEKAGVDALFIARLKTRAELEALHAEVRLPIMFGSHPEVLRDYAYLAQQGVRMAIRGHFAMRAAVQGMHAALTALADGAEDAAIGNLATPALMKQVTHAGDYGRWQEAFLGQA